MAIKEDLRQKIPNFVKLPVQLEEEYVRYFTELNIVPDKICVYDRLSLSEEVTILATIKTDTSTKFTSLTYNNITKKILIDNV